MPKFCAKCGNPLKENDKFCRKCGAPVRQTAGAAPVTAAKEPENISNPKAIVVKSEIVLSLDEMLRGCNKVVDFGTGKRYRITIPEGLTPGDTLVVEDSGIVDQETGTEYIIELSTVIE